MLVDGVLYAFRVSSNDTMCDRILIYFDVYNECDNDVQEVFPSSQDKVARHLRK